VSISSVLSPSAWASQIASKNPLAAAATYGAGSFASMLMQALHHHGHHGGGRAALQSLQQSLPAGSATAPGLGRLLNTRA
jgi:hypothetical protein